MMPEVYVPGQEEGIPTAGGGSSAAPGVYVPGQEDSSEDPKDGGGTQAQEQLDSEEEEESEEGDGEYVADRARPNYNNNGYHKPYKRPHKKKPNKQGKPAAIETV